VGTRDDDGLVVEACEEVYPPAGAIQERLAIQERTELLGPGLAGDRPGQRSQPDTVTSGKDQRPRGLRQARHRASVRPFTQPRFWSHRRAGREMATQQRCRTPACSILAQFKEMTSRMGNEIPRLRSKRREAHARGAGGPSL